MTSILSSVLFERDAAGITKTKGKEIREERKKIQERIEEAKKLFKEMCAAEIPAWEEIDATLEAQGVPKSKQPSKPHC